MVHGGTNFGLTAGSLNRPNRKTGINHFTSFITSYDYQAPISEQGSPTTNYHTFRSLLFNNTKEENLKKFPKIQEPIKSMAFPDISLNQNGSFFDHI